MTQMPGSGASSFLKVHRKSPLEMKKLNSLGIYVIHQKVTPDATESAVANLSFFWNNIELRNLQ